MELLVIICMARELANKKDKTNDRNKKIKEIIFLRMNDPQQTNVMEIHLIFIEVIIIVRITLNLLMHASIVIAMFYYLLLVKLIIIIFLMNYLTRDL